MEASIARVNRAAEEAGAREGTLPGDAASVAVPGGDASGDDEMRQNQAAEDAENKRLAAEMNNVEGTHASFKQAWAQAVSMKMTNWMLMI